MPQRHEDIKFHKEKFLPLSVEEEAIGRAIVNAAYVVHKELGPGLLEKVYEVCFCHVLTNKRLGFLINFNVPLIMNGIKRMVL